MTTICWFTCKRCGYLKKEVDVRDRQEGEPVSRWISAAVVPAVRGAHLTRAPLCTATKAAIFVPREGGGERSLGYKEFH